MHVLEENPQGIRWIDLLLAVEATRPDGLTIASMARSQPADDPRVG
jgi:hypothetical protein